MFDWLRNVEECQQFMVTLGMVDPSALPTLKGLLRQQAYLEHVVATHKIDAGYDYVTLEFVFLHRWSNSSGSLLATKAFALCGA